MKLEDTIGLMCSDDFKDRLKAEYLQLVIRLHMLMNYWQTMEDRLSLEGGHILEQIGAMKSYKSALRRRLYDAGLFPDTLDAICDESKEE